MRRPREGHDRGRWLLFVPPQPLELVARPDFGRPVALCVRRDGLPAEGLAARAAYGRGVDVRGVRRDPGRTPPFSLRVHERPTRGTAAGHGERIPPADRGQDAHQLRGRPRGLYRRGRGNVVEISKQFSVMERLVEVCEKRGHLLVGISKDSQLHAFGHVLTDEELMARCQDRLPPDALAYARAPKAAEVEKEGLLYGDIYYARLHPRARKWFRVDLGTFRDRPDEAFGQLSSFGKSLVSVGYPWPLIEAHRMAVTVRQLKPVYQESVLKMALRMGLDVRTILDGLTQVEGRKRSAFHEYLDKVARDLR